jgi:hypothetical protein
LYYDGGVKDLTLDELFEGFPYLWETNNVGELE